MEEIKGVIEEIVYRNEENSYTVAMVGEASDTVAVVGYLPGVEAGRSFSFFGEWVNHKTYGQQLNVTSFEEIMPDTKDGILGFLSSGILKGVGNKTALAMVNHFGMEILEIVENNPMRLAEVDGIGKIKADSIGEDYQKHREYANIMIALQKYQISGAYAMKLYKKYGKEAVNVVVENPYRLIEDVEGIGFKIADQIAGKIGIDPNSEYRVGSGIKYVLSQMASDGHTFMPKTALCEKVASFLEVDNNLIQEVLRELTILGDIHMETMEGRPVVFLAPYFYAETGTCKNIIRLLSSEHKVVNADVEGLIRATETESGIALAKSQTEAVRATVKNGVCILTGGPGTGKTTTIHTMIKVFRKSGLEIAIAAPTGRAAKRITETTGEEAKTIHRMLEYCFSDNEQTMVFGKNQDNPLEADVIIIDEASMIDILLMNGLLNAIGSGSRLILVGDSDQLPSVGAGNVLKDMIDSEIIHTVKLSEIFRQAKESLIVVNAHRINRGEYPAFNEKGKDFFLLKKRNEKQILEIIRELSLYRLPNYFEGCDPVKDMQILTPVRKGLLGANHLNIELQKILNPPAQEKTEKILKTKVFREGDKVMQIKNNYGIKWKRLDDFTDGEGIFNGDMGYIHTINNQDNEVTVVYEDVKATKYDFTQLEELEHAYAVTVHKSQGSEYPIVIMPIAWFPPMLATRNLLYTAVTRAKKAVVLVGGEDYMNAMVDNNSIVERYSGLRWRLKVLLEIY